MRIQKLLKAGYRFVTDPNYRFLLQSGKGKYNHLPDKEYLKRLYQAKMGKPLDLENPRTFNEKIQWIKLYDRKPAYTMMADKYAVRAYIAEKLGDEYLIPLLGVWDDPEEIDFNALPDQFVLKCNHNSGLGMCICKDKSKLNIKKVKEELKKGLRQDYYLTGREWPYKNIKRRIIAEQYIVDSKGKLDDYKFMCFNGVVECSFVCSERFSGKGLHVTFFDREWKVLPFERQYPSVKEGFARPSGYERMVEMAELLTKEIPFARVDFYDVDGKIFFGELTFFPGSGMEAFSPEVWDEKLGDMIRIPE